MSAEQMPGQAALEDEYATGYAAGRRDALAGMLAYLCSELHPEDFIHGYEEGAKA